MAITLRYTTTTTGGKSTALTYEELNQNFKEFMNLTSIGNGQYTLNGLSVNAASATNADKLDNLDSTQFLRADALDVWAYANTTPNASQNGVTLDYDLSGTTALTFNRTKTALSIDLDHTSTGGTTTDGQRETLYGGNFDVLTSGTPYYAYGIYGHVRSANTTGTINAIIGVRGYAEGDSGTGGTNTSVYGVQGDARDGGAGAVSNVYGGHFYVLKETGAATTLAVAVGTRSEVEIDLNTITNAYAAQHIIDIDGGTLTNSYLTYGAYEGTIQSGCWSAYYPSNAPNYFLGEFRLGANTDLGGQKLQVSGTAKITGAVTLDDNLSVAKSLGVGTAASGTTGEIRATGDVVTAYSDERLKDFHGTILNAIDKINQLNGYYFTGNQTAKDLGYTNDKIQVGLSAQEVERVLPEIVVDAPIENDQGYKTIKYDKMVPLLVEAIKEQQTIIDSQKIQLEEQNARLAMLEQQITMLINKL